MTSQTETDTTPDPISSLTLETLDVLDILSVSVWGAPGNLYRLGDAYAGPYIGEFTREAVETAARAALACEAAGGDAEAQFSALHAALADA
jgi:hypothetical protein